MNREDIIRMAREAGFENSEYGLNCTPGMYAYNMEIVERFAALVAAAERKALAEQPAQQQEPVAWIDICEKGQMSGLRYWSEPDNRHEVPLYTSPPPQRTWVGLTDEEMLAVVHYSQLDNARAIEAKLKEKNA